MRLIFGHDQSQVSLSEDQHPVGDLGPGGEYEPLGKSVRTRASGRIFTGWMPALASAASRESVNCPALSRIRK
jgi:hypothetical protein